MTTHNTTGLRLCLAVAALGIWTAGALAQQPPAPAAPAAAPAAPAKVVPKVEPKAPVKAVPAAPAADAKAPVVAPKAAEKTVAAPSPCKGLDEKSCGAKAAECAWIVPKKLDAKTGKADAPYCRKVAGIAKKKAEAKAAAPAAKIEAPKAAAPATKIEAPKAAAPAAKVEVPKAAVVPPPAPAAKK